MNTQRRQWLRWGSGLFAAGLAGQGAFAGVADRQLVWRERALIGFGTTLWLRAAHNNADQLELALNAAVKSIRSVEADMSLFSPDSAVSRLNHDGVLHKPSAQLLSVLSLSLIHI